MTPCPRQNCKGKAIVDPIYGVLPCKMCQARDEKNAHARRLPKILTLSMQDRITHQQDRNAKDILQPFIGNQPNPEFVRAYPELRSQYFTKEQLSRI